MKKAALLQTTRHALAQEELRCVRNYDRMRWHILARVSAFFAEVKNLATFVEADCKCCKNNAPAKYVAWRACGEESNLRGERASCCQQLNLQIEKVNVKRAAERAYSLAGARMHIINPNEFCELRTKHRVW